VDVGGGTSEMAVTALGGMVIAHSLRVGGYDLDEAIVRLVQNEEKLLIGQEQAEALKIEIGSAVPDALVNESAQVAGRDLTTGLLRRATVNASSVREALHRPLAQIAAAVTDVLERTPPELSADIGAHGLTLVGGGALLHGFDRLIEQETGLDVTIDADPLTTVARGAGEALEELETLRPVRRSR
jgi:rod shape-determining protein MreB